MKIKILHTDAIEFLKSHDNKSLPTIITGIPDMDEVEMDENKYTLWLENVCQLIYNKIRNNEYCIFIQTDRKVNGQWIDKSYHLQSIGAKCNMKLLWHKIVLYRPVNSIHLQRPTYGHILCFCHQSSSNGPGKQFPDVIEGGKKLYKNGTSIEPLHYIMKFCNEKKIKCIIDPFAGYGTISLIAKKYNISSLAIDIDKECIEKMNENLN